MLKATRCDDNIVPTPVGKDQKLFGECVGKILINYEGTGMDKDLMVKFLTKEAIKTPSNTIYKDRLWAAIRKAHRDVMTGARTKNISKYTERNKGGKNTTLDYLYEQISAEKGSLCSETLIKKLRDKDKEIEFAAIQKLVNMTLKYLIILKEYEETSFDFTICEEKCDCPIDSIILERLKEINGKNHECWTNMGKSEYEDVQEEIQSHLKKQYKDDTHGNIWFDFLYWE